MAPSIVNRVLSHFQRDYMSLIYTPRGVFGDISRLYLDGLKSSGMKPIKATNHPLKFLEELEKRHPKYAIIEPLMFAGDILHKRYPDSAVQDLQDAVTQNIDDLSDFSISGNADSPTKFYAGFSVSGSDVQEAVGIDVYDASNVGGALLELVSLSSETFFVYLVQSIAELQNLYRVRELATGNKGEVFSCYLPELPDDRLIRGDYSLIGIRISPNEIGVIIENLSPWCLEEICKKSFSANSSAEENAYKC